MTIKKKKIPTKSRGKPTTKPKRVTCSIAPLHAVRLQSLADEAEVSITAFCTHILEHYAMQPNEHIAIDVLEQRLAQQQREHANAFGKRFGDIIYRQAHEIVALRNHVISMTANDIGIERAEELAEMTWEEAVKSLYKYSKRNKNKDNDDDDEEARETETQTESESREECEGQTGKGLLTNG